MDITIDKKWIMGIIKMIIMDIQWPLQELKLEVPTIYNAYKKGLNFREYLIEI